MDHIAYIFRKKTHENKRWWTRSAVASAFVDDSVSKTLAANQATQLLRFGMAKYNLNRKHRKYLTRLMGDLGGSTAMLFCQTMDISPRSRGIVSRTKMASRLVAGVLEHLRGQDE